MLNIYFAAKLHFSVSFAEKGGFIYGKRISDHSGLRDFVFNSLPAPDPLCGLWCKKQRKGSLDCMAAGSRRLLRISGRYPASPIEPAFFESGLSGLRRQALCPILPCSGFHRRPLRSGRQVCRSKGHGKAAHLPQRLRCRNGTWRNRIHDYRGNDLYKQSVVHPDDQRRNLRSAG